MDFRLFFEPIFNGVVTVFGWLTQIGGEFFWAEFFTIFIILTVARLFFRRITGVHVFQSFSDSVKSVGSDKGDDT